MTQSTRPSRGSFLTISLGRAESAEWVADAEFRTTLIKGVAKRARDKGRRYFEVRGERGEALHVGEVSS